MTDYNNYLKHNLLTNSEKESDFFEKNKAVTQNAVKRKKLQGIPKSVLEKVNILYF